MPGSPYGIGDEVMAACRDRHGCWASVELMRDAGEIAFSQEDALLLHDLAPALGRFGVVAQDRSVPGLVVGGETAKAGAAPAVIAAVTTARMGLSPAHAVGEPAVRLRLKCSRKGSKADCDAELQNVGEDTPRHRLAQGSGAGARRS